MADGCSRAWIESIIDDLNPRGPVAPDAGMGSVPDGVFLDAVALASLIYKHPVVVGSMVQRTPEDVMDIVSRDYGARLKAECIDTAAVSQHLHDVVDVIVQYPVVSRWK